MSTTIFPSANVWCTSRSFDSRITSDNCSIILPQTIDKIDKMLLNGSGFTVHVQFKINQGASESEYNLNELYLDKAGSIALNALDITKWIVEKNEYNSLQLINRGLSEIEKRSIIKNNTWFYEHNSKSITLVNSIMGVVFPINVFSRLVEAAVLSLGTTYVKYKDDYGNSYISEVINVSVPSHQNLFAAQFRINYTPLGESVKLQVPKTNPQANEFCIPYSQQQQIVDNITLGREMQSIANRAGCETKEVVRTLRSFAEVRHPNDGWYYNEKDANNKLTGNVWRLNVGNITSSRQVALSAV